MKIVMILNKASRELAIMKSIEAWLTRLEPGTQVRILDFHTPNYHHEILEFAPDIIFTFPFTAISTSIPIYLLKFALKCHVICFRTEGVINFDFERQVLGNVGLERYGANFVDYELFWGERFAQAVGQKLCEVGKLSSPQRIRTFGYPPYEGYFSASGRPSALPAEYRDRVAAFARDKVIFFIAGFPLADYTAQDIINSGDCLDPNAENREAELEIALDGVKRSQFFRRLWIKEITDVAGSHPEVLVIVKSHPIEQEIQRDTGIDPYAAFAEYDNILYINTPVPVADIIPCCGLFVHYGSTAVGETYLSEIPSIFVSIDDAYQGKVNATNAMYYHNDLGWPSTRKTQVEGLRGVIEEHLASPLPFEFSPLMKKILKDQFNIDEEHLARKRDYLPSRDLAQFLLGLRGEASQVIPADDPHLVNALKLAGMQSVLFLCDRAISRFDAGDFSGARRLFARAALLAKPLEMEIPHVDRVCAQAELEALAAVGEEDPGAATVPANFEAALARHLGQSQQPGSAQPKTFMIETTLACDLRCPECAIGGKLIHRKQGMMRLEQFKIIADKIRPYVQYLYLHIWGEPMLNPDIIEMIRYVAGFTRTNISTNGMSMTEERAEQLITSGVSDILVSIDGLSQEVYGSYRVGGRVEQAFAALEMLQRFNRKHGGKVSIKPQFVVFKHNQHEMEPFRERCLALGLEPSFKAPYLRAGSQFQNSDLPQYVRERYPDPESLRAAMTRCPDPREVFTILQDGSAVACCYDHDGQTAFGNILQQEVLEIWNSPRYQEFRRNLLSGNTPGFCTENCMSYFLDGTAGAPAATAAPAAARPAAAASAQPAGTRSGAAARKGGRRPRTDRGAGHLPEELLALARDSFARHDYNEAFDLYEQLTESLPGQRVPVLAEIYDRYQSLPDQETRYHLYVSRFFDFALEPGDKVLDIGSGHLPFPFATHLADLSLSDGSVGRAGVPFRYLDGKPVYECGVERMPFADKEFDFVYCSHVLEHADDPEQACRELMRVARRGYIETPTRGKDLWLDTAKLSNHRWAVEWSHDTLIFTEYRPEEVEGLGCNILLDMHCAPQNEREKAFSALVYLKADLVNTMVYWEDSFKFEVRRLPRGAESDPAQAGGPRAALAEPPAPAVESAAPGHAAASGPPQAAAPLAVPSPQGNPAPSRSGDKPHCVFLNTYYGAFLQSFYGEHPQLLSAPYAEQQRALEAECFGDSDFYSQGLIRAGWRATDLIINCLPLQQAWAREHGVDADGEALVLEQVRRLAPEVVYIQDMHVMSAEFLKALRPLTRLVVGQIASPFGGHIALDLYDIVFTSFPHYVERFRQLGTTAYYQPLAFEPRVLQALPQVPWAGRPVDCSFVGGISPLHTAGTALLETLVQQSPIRLWGYGADQLPQDSPLKGRHGGETWGKEMFGTLAASRITVNRHVDVAEEFANNMRLYEATGCGALLITDYKENLNDLFEIGKEVVAYRSAEECAALINYYLAHPEEAQAIARAGQQRTLREHSYARRLEQSAEILERHLRYQGELKRLPELDLSRISSGHTAIDSGEVTQAMTRAWQDAEIPPRQRALVQRELEQMYRGQVNPAFQVLAQLLRPHLAPGTPVLEIGCASGYYCEILEYLLHRQIDYTGVDYSEAMIEMARRYYPKGRFFAADGANLFFEDRQFHTVISSCVLLHVPNYREHIFETARVADQVVVAARTPVCKRRPTQYLKKLAYGVETVELVFNEQELLGEFALNRFQPVQALYYQEDQAADLYTASYLFQRV